MSKKLEEKLPTRSADFDITINVDGYEGAVVRLSVNGIPDTDVVGIKERIEVGVKQAFMSSLESRKWLLVFDGNGGKEVLLNLALVDTITIEKIVEV